MKDYDEATIRGMRQILSDHRAAKGAKKSPNEFIVVIHTEPFYEAFERKPPTVWQRVKAWLVGLVGS